MGHYTRPLPSHICFASPQTIQTWDLSPSILFQNNLFQDTEAEIQLWQRPLNTPSSYSEVNSQPGRGYRPVTAVAVHYRMHLILFLRPAKARAAKWHILVQRVEEKAFPNSSLSSEIKKQHQLTSWEFFLVFTSYTENSMAVTCALL